MEEVKENTRTLSYEKNIENEYCGLVKKVLIYDNEYGGGRLNIQPIYV